jgi:mono/diheme cytochrome c family protein
MNFAAAKRSFYPVLAALLVLLSFPGRAQDAAASWVPTDEAVVSGGATLFRNNCAVCHQVHQQLVGPALANVYERHSREWLNAFIVNSQRVIQGGDEYAVNLYNQYNKTLMPSFDFSEDEVLSILAYIQSETLKGPAPVAAADAGEVPAAAAGEGRLLTSGYLTAFLIALLVVMVMIIVVLIMLISVLTRYLRQKSGLGEAELEVLEQRFDLGKALRSPAFIWVATFIFTAVVLKGVIDGLYSVGVQQDYAPTQPIAFSHKLHAGDFKIDCQYCHTTASYSKSASIPSANICMNCHQSIIKVTGSQENSTEIQKIYAAIENDQPIQWIRVHNLPDLAYFNHAQHYSVGGIECQTCHGPVEEMEVLKQHSNLTMGWCIDCHRTTVVKTEGNAYYDKLVELHQAVSKEPMVVEDIGGLECAKCHY